MNLMEALKKTGKARRTSWSNQGYHIFPDRERRCFKASDFGSSYFIGLPFENIIAEDWEPYQEPCQHEPKQFEFRAGYSHGLASSKLETVESNTMVLFQECSKCGAKIRADKWVEA